MSVLSIFAYSQVRKLGFQKSEIYKHSSFRYLPVAKYEHQNEVQDTSSSISLSGKNKKNEFLDSEIQALTKDGYFRKDLSFCILILTNIRKAGCSAGRLEISDFCDLSFHI